MSKTWQEIVGPRTSEEDRKEHRLDYLLPTLLLSLAAILLIISIFFPYWNMKLEAPQYPKCLFVTAYVNRLEGDVKEIDGLNHYIGMRPLEEAAQLVEPVTL